MANAQHLKCCDLNRSCRFESDSGHLILVRWFCARGAPALGGESDRRQLMYAYYQIRTFVFVFRINMEIITAARTLALQEIEKYGTPPPILFEISKKKALKLAEQLNADKIIVSVGILLMDLKLGQALKENRLSEHVAMSVAGAKEFLEQFSIDGEMKSKIINCVEAHHKDVPFNCIEAEICANADCYRFIHPRGFFAYLSLLAGERGLDFPEILNQAEKKLDEKHAILSLKTCEQELEGYYQTFKKFLADAREF